MTPQGGILNLETERKKDYLCEQFPDHQHKVGREFRRHLLPMLFADE